MMKYSLFLLIGLMISCAEKDSSATYNQPASAIRLDSVNFNPIQETVLSSFINAKQRTMSTLYGNDIAARYAQTGQNQQYPVGSVLSLVTWKQQPDPRWFGGNIPGEVNSVEIIWFVATTQGQVVPVYRRYAGNPLRQKLGGHQEAERIAFISRERMFITPQ